MSPDRQIEQMMAFAEHMLGLLAARTGCDVSHYYSEVDRCYVIRAEQGPAASRQYAVVKIPRESMIYGDRDTIAVAVADLHRTLNGQEPSAGIIDWRPAETTPEDFYLG